MQLSLHADYACRCLIYLAVEQEGSVSKIARAYGISRNHLVKVVHRLGQKGYLTTTRGKGGGIRLAKDPQKIGLGDIVRDMEAHFDLVECFDASTNTCRIASGCGLRHALKEARAAFLRVLDAYTLTELIANKPFLQRAFAPGVKGN